MFKTKLISFYLLLLVSYALSAQIESDTTAIISGWQLDDDFLQPIKTDVDTNIVQFQRYNSVMKQSSISHLGGNGSAYISNNFFDRDQNEEFFFLNSYKGYFYTYDNTQYLNTRRPFSHLYYLSGDSKADKDESIQLQHTQNINPKLNFGFMLNIHSNKNQYRYLTVKNKNFKGHVSYSGERYKLHSTFNNNTYLSEESGGIVDSLFIAEEEDYKTIGSNFKGEVTSPYKAYAGNKIRYLDGMLSQKLRLFTIGAKDDTIGTNNSVAEPIVSHVLKIRRVSKIYTDDLIGNTTSSGIYNNYYTNSILTYDSIAQYSLSNKIQLDFKTRLKNKVTAGVYGSINHEYIKYSFYTENDTNIKSDTSTLADSYIDNSGNRLLKIDQANNQNNMFLTAGVYGQFWTYFQSSFSGKLYFLGEKAGQTQLQGNLKTQAVILNKPYSLHINGSIDNLVPSLLLNSYYSNNYIWEQELNSVNKLLLSSKLAAPSNKFELSGKYALFRNYIYFSDSLPVNYKPALNIFSVGIEKEFVLWRFHSYNKIQYQVSSNSDIVEIPDVIIYNSTYIDKTWNFNLTGGKLRTLVGFDINYTTQFNGYNYNPALSTFYQDNSSYKVGNYPFVDVWMNVRLKRTRFFAKYEHINNTWWDRRKDSYHAVSYPSLKERFIFGLSWTFYN